MIKQGNDRLSMVKRTAWYWLIGSFVCFVTPLVRAQTLQDTLLKRCAIEGYERVLQRRDPDRLRQLNELNRRVEQRLEQAKSLRSVAADTTIYRIPIVVHVVHSTASGAIGGANNVNISDAQIASQIQVLNEDYRRKPNTNGYNTNPLGADARIEFFLATSDQYGNPSTGITRTYYAPKSSFDVFSNDDELLSQIAYWPSDRYLNIWVTSLQNNYLGFSQFPTAGDTLQGLTASISEKIDGSIIDYRVFGKQTGTVTSSLYLLGRTVTHEIGHWLGLFHPWGNGCTEDYVADTPLTEDRSVAPNSCRQTYSTCVAGKQTRDLIENYLMYSPDICMNMFTAGQVARMRAVLAISPRRANMIRSVTSPLKETDHLTLTVYPNPAVSDPLVDVQLKGSQSFSIDLFDLTGRQLRTMAYTDSPSTRLTLPITGLSKGVYIVRVKTNNETASKRLLVQ